MNQQEMGSLCQGLKKVFDLVRLVDAEDMTQFSLDSAGNICKEQNHCYSSWHKHSRCDNCISLRALEQKTRAAKFEFIGKDVYYVLSLYVEVEQRPYVLELVSKVDDNTLCGIYGQDGFPESMETLNQKLYIDPVTGAYNRRYFEDQFSKRSGISAVAMVDVDDFKVINDTFGHPAGDVALHRVADILYACSRKSDGVVRYGGDELMLLYHKISKDAFQERLEQIRKAVAKTDFEQFPGLALTVSIGGIYKDENVQIKDTIPAADRLLYLAKEEKNQVQFGVYQA